MNRWANLGVALCLFALVLNVAYMISWSLLLWLLVIPGLFIWWMGCLALSYFINMTILERFFDDE